MKEDTSTATRSHRAGRASFAGRERRGRGSQNSNLGNGNALHSRYGKAVLRLLFFHFNAQRFQELQVLVADFELKIARRGRGDERRFLRIALARLADANGGLKHKENVIAAVLDSGNNFGDGIRVSQRFVDRLAKLLHKLL